MLMTHRPQVLVFRHNELVGSGSASRPQNELGSESVTGMLNIFKRKDLLVFFCLQIYPISVYKYFKHAIMLQFTRVYFIRIRGKNNLSAKPIWRLPTLLVNFQLSVCILGIEPVLESNTGLSL